MYDAISILQRIIYMFVRLKPPCIGSSYHKYFLDKDYIDSLQNNNLTDSIEDPFYSVKKTFTQTLYNLYKNNRFNYNNIVENLPDYIYDLENIRDKIENEINIIGGDNNCDLNDIIKECYTVIDTDTYKNKEIEDLMKIFFRYFLNNKNIQIDTQTIKDNINSIQFLKQRKNLLPSTSNIYNNVIFIEHALDFLTRHNFKLPDETYEQISQMFENLFKVHSQIYILTLIFMALKTFGEYALSTNLDCMEIDEDNKILIPQSLIEKINEESQKIIKNVNNLSRIRYDNITRKITSMDENINMSKFDDIIDTTESNL